MPRTGRAMPARAEQRTLRPLALLLLALVALLGAAVPCAEAKTHTVVWNGNLRQKDPIRGTRGDRVRFIWGQGAKNVVEQPGPGSFKNCVWLPGLSKKLFPKARVMSATKGNVLTAPLTSGTKYYGSFVNGPAQCKAGLKWAIYIP